MLGGRWAVKGPSGPLLGWKARSCHANVIGCSLIAALWLDSALVNLSKALVSYVMCERSSLWNVWHMVREDDFVWGLSLCFEHRSSLLNVGCSRHISQSKRGSKEWIPPRLMCSMQSRIKQQQSTLTFRLTDTSNSYAANKHPLISDDPIQRIEDKVLIQQFVLF